MDIAFSHLALLWEYIQIQTLTCPAMMENGWSWAHLTSVGGVDTNNWWPMLWNATLLHVIVRYLQNWMEFPLDPSPPCGHTGASLMFVCFLVKVPIGSWLDQDLEIFGALETANASYFWPCTSPSAAAIKECLGDSLWRQNVRGFGRCPRVAWDQGRCQLRKFWRWLSKDIIFKDYHWWIFWIIIMVYNGIIKDYLWIIIVWKWISRISPIFRRTKKYHIFDRISLYVSH